MDTFNQDWIFTKGTVGGKARGGEEGRECRQGGWTDRHRQGGWTDMEERGERGTAGGKANREISLNPMLSLLVRTGGPEKKLEDCS